MHAYVQVCKARAETFQGQGHTKDGMDNMGKMGDDKMTIPVVTFAAIRMFPGPEKGHGILADPGERNSSGPTSGKVTAAHEIDNQ